MRRTDVIGYGLLIFVGTILADISDCFFSVKWAVGFAGSAFLGTLAVLLIISFFKGYK